MKKLLVGILTVMAIALAAIYFIIPHEIKITEVILCKGSAKSVARNFLQAENWNNWLKSDFQNNSLTYKNCTISHLKKLSEIDGSINISYEDKMAQSHLMINQIGKDSVLLNWTCSIISTNNPFTKISNYSKANHIKKTIAEILTLFNQYFSSTKNIYGFNVVNTTLQDSSMIAIKASINHFPTTEDIYAKIAALEEYAKANNASSTNFPMLNIRAKDSMGNYDFMVAIPINKRLFDKNEIVYKQMLPNGNFLCSDSIYGGMRKIEKDFSNFIKYKEDFEFLSPAIPFQSLITDRRKEADSTKWITRFYYPVF